MTIPLLDLREKLAPSPLKCFYDSSTVVSAAVVLDKGGGACATIIEGPFGIQIPRLL